jgi:hypothetical protein
MSQQALEFKHTPSLAWVVLAMLLIAGALLVGVRGTTRAMTGSGDLRMLYAAGNVWLNGGNPYVFDEVVSVYRADGGDPENKLTPQMFVTLYPPSTLPVLAPLGLFNFQQAKIVLVLINLIGVAALVWLSAQICAIGREGQAWLWVAALVLVLTPVSSTMAMGQITIPVVALFMLGLLWERRGRSVLAGVTLGLATAIKPQLVGMLVIWLAWRGNWYAFFAACVVGFVLAGIAVLRMELADANWWPHMIENLRAFKNGGNGDPTQSNPAGWWKLMNLPVMLHVFTENRAVVGLVSWSVFGLLMLGTALLGRSLRRPDGLKETQSAVISDDLIVPSMMVLACLIPVYHRHYDAVSLLVPLCWVVMRWREGRVDGPVKLVSATLLLFYIPNVVVLIHSVINPRLPASIVESVWWRASAMNLLVWSMLMMAGGLLWAMARLVNQQMAQAPPGTEAAA